MFSMSSSSQLRTSGKLNLEAQLFKSNSTAERMETDRPEYVDRILYLVVKGL